MEHRQVGRAAVVSLFFAGAMVGSAEAASAAPPNPDKASCVEQFNLAVGTPGEYQRTAHQDQLGRDVSYFARLSEEECPF
jgi:hypothetical protein